MSQQCMRVFQLCDTISLSGRPIIGQLGIAIYSQSYHCSQHARGSIAQVDGDIVVGFVGGDLPMPVVRCWPEVSVKHQRRRLVVDATTTHDKTTTKPVTVYPDGSVGSRVSSLQQAVSITFRWYLSYALQHTVRLYSQLAGPLFSQINPMNNAPRRPKAQTSLQQSQPPLKSYDGDKMPPKTSRRLEGSLQRYHGRNSGRFGH